MMSLPLVKTHTATDNPTTPGFRDEMGSPDAYEKTLNSTSPARILTTTLAHTSSSRFDNVVNRGRIG